MDLGKHFLKQAIDTFREIREGDVSEYSLLLLQSNVIKSLADASLIFFSNEEDEKVEKAYEEFLSVLEFLRDRNLFLGAGLLQLNLLKNLNPTRGFSLDRRFGRPREILIWSNRIVKPYLFLATKSPKYENFRDPLFNLGADISPQDRLFPYLVSSARRILEKTGAPWRIAGELMKWELFLGYLKGPLQCRDGYVKIIDSLPRILEGALSYSLSDDVEVYELGPRSGPFVEVEKIICFSKKLNKGFIVGRW
ncbi:hypothetical protein A3L04_10395 [Thermococcus chitonophagus]|uniref:Uncharacterized protein n=1 Tax=Thermococcus chitonophagus TaxID=54262 RepID=A0A160VU44_9EURY|nr:hypothetical protein [Thermococcus chitonophagus]ASJ17449.1 hypothetical protein A3L04_10395 [Thermococcus chitonophagus]CUX78096.1 hypothetical protein CHITON_1317 [Thermococcus chitonophagus]